MQTVTVSPFVVWRESHNAASTADVKVELFGFKERSMTAVMKNDKYPDKKSSCKEDQRQCEPEGYFKCKDH
jgi:hypothetical protein